MLFIVIFINSNRSTTCCSSYLSFVVAIINSKLANRPNRPPNRRPNKRQATFQCSMPCSMPCSLLAIVDYIRRVYNGVRRCSRSVLNSSSSPADPLRVLAVLNPCLNAVLCRSSFPGPTTTSLCKQFAKLFWHPAHEKRPWLGLTNFSALHRMQFYKART